MRKISIKGLKKKIWLVLRVKAVKRDEHRCQVCGNSGPKAGLQIDHCFSRRIGRLHFEIENLTTLCSRCHTIKSFQKGGSLDKQVDEIVRSREGYGWWAWALKESKKPFHDFSSRWWLEKKLNDCHMLKTTKPPSIKKEGDE